MTKEAKVNRKDVLPMVESIKELTEKIAVVVATIPEGYIRNSYETSVKNLRTKNDNFLEVKAAGARGLSDEEKAIIKAMRAGQKVEVSEVPSSDGGEEDSSAPESEATKTTTRKSRKH